MTKADAAEIFPEGFSRYSLKSVQQDDLSVRRKLATELEKVRSHLQGLHEESHRGGNTKATDAVRRVLDEVDLFQGELRLAEGGAKLPFFSANRSATPETIADLIDFDYKALSSLAQARDAAQLLESETASATPEATVTGLSQLRVHLTTARNAWKDRRDLLRGIR